MARLRLGILGGTFDPVHLGHLVLGETAREQLRLGRVLFVPARQPWRKAGRAVAPAEHRLAMLRLAVKGAPAFEVSTLELERPGPTYTVDTLEALSGEAELFFLVGGDALADLPNWRQPGRIVELATLAVARRPGDTLDVDALGLRLPGLPARLVEIDMPLIDISASTIRARVGKGLSIRYLVPDEVEAYVRKHELYRR